MEEHQTNSKCPVSGLNITTNQAYNNVPIAGKYRVSLSAIGNNIVYSANEGDLHFTDIDKYYALVESFMEEEKITYPFIEIRDYSNLTGIAPGDQFRKQSKYIESHVQDFKAMIFCNLPDNMRHVLETVAISGEPIIPLFICDNYRSAILKALEVEKNSLKSMVKLNLEQIRFDNAWEFKADDFSIRNGIISNRILFTELTGIARTEYMPEVEKVMRSVFKDMKPDNSTYIRIADYSALKKVPIRSRNRYGELLNELNNIYNTTPTTTYICGASPFIRAAMKLYKSFVNQNFAFPKTVQEAFEQINTYYNLKPEVEKTYILKQSDIDELIELSGALIWGGTRITTPNLSPTNPLRQLADTFSIVKDDLVELRTKEKEQSMLLRQNVTVTKKLNEDLLKANQKLNAQKEKLEQAKDQLIELNGNLEIRISERTKKLEQTVEQLNKTIAELDRFVYSASHDLSAPLKSIRGLVSLAKVDPETENVGTYLQHIDNSIKNLEEVIRNLISYSRNSRLAVASKPVNLHDLVEEVYSNLAFVDGYDRVQLKNNIDSDVVIRSDKTRLNVIFHNLISNSIKYADQDKAHPYIEINCRPQGQETWIEVKDNGQGIEDDHILKIFTMFYRATEKSSGSGLGLFIVHETINVLQGKIFVESTAGQGSKFTFMLPVAMQQVGRDILVPGDN